MEITAGLSFLIFAACSMVVSNKNWILKLDMDLEYPASGSSEECIDETQYEDEDITEVVGTLSEMSDDYPVINSEDEDFDGALLTENR